MVAHFLPATQRWFAAHYKKATPIQLGAFAAVSSGACTLLCAPTGSGKTLAAFLASIDALYARMLRAPLPAGVQILYVSPLKALSRDIERNLLPALQGIADELGVEPLRVALRTGDTSPAQRQRLLRQPPHILATTPESLYLLLTSVKGRPILRSVRWIIVDEIHALLDSRRGSHLMLSLARLDRLCAAPPQRIGLSATQRPLHRVADYLRGSGPRQLGLPLDLSALPPEVTVTRHGDGVICEQGAARPLDVRLELPTDPLGTVCSAEQWEELYNRLAALVAEHRSTLIFVNTRRLAERLSYHLSARLGEGKAAAHHGSLSAPLRQAVEARLKAGTLPCLVATASLELGIDIGAIDLVCQVGAVAQINAFIQRLGRANHQVGAVPKGRIFPLNRHELLQCSALLQALTSGTRDVAVIPAHPLDILAQQIVAEVVAAPATPAQLWDLVQTVYPYQQLSRAAFDRLLSLLVEGFIPAHGRSSGLLELDSATGLLQGRPGARLRALTGGGAIGEIAEYPVYWLSGEAVVGSVNEEFAVDSNIGDVFALGNRAWQVRYVRRGKVFVEQAPGQSPAIPFWFGESPPRSEALSAQVNALLQAAQGHFSQAAAGPWQLPAGSLPAGSLPAAGAAALHTYLADTYAALGCIPSQTCVVAERFFDASSGMHVVIHAPFGRRINKAWGLALRKRFCRSFNFELQAAATDDAVLISLSQSHSFPLQEVFSFLSAKTVRSVLTAAILDVPLFTSRWQWNITRSLALARFRGGKKTPPHVLRMQSEDLLAAVFPDQQACLENIVGERRIPDHPLVLQTLQDCLQEDLDCPGLSERLTAMADGRIACRAIDTDSPSPLAQQVVSARAFDFLDEAPLEERRTRAVQRRAAQPSGGIWPTPRSDALSAAQRQRLAPALWPNPTSPQAMHSALLQLGVLAPADLNPAWLPLLKILEAEGRATCQTLPDAQGEPQVIWLAKEAQSLVRLVFNGGPLPAAADLQLGDLLRGVLAELSPYAQAPEGEALGVEAAAAGARAALLRGRLELLPGASAPELASALLQSLSATEQALLQLERAGTVLRAQDAETQQTLYVHRRVLLRLRHSTAATPPPLLPFAGFCRFLLHWQRLLPARQATQGNFLEVLALLAGYSAPLGCFERQLLGRRCQGYDEAWLDVALLLGGYAFARCAPWSGSEAPQGRSAFSLRKTPMAFFLREEEALWRGARGSLAPSAGALADVHRHLSTHGALFFADLQRALQLLPTHLRTLLQEGLAKGLLTADLFAPVRSLLQSHRAPSGLLPRLARQPSWQPPSGRFVALAAPQVPSPTAIEALADKQAACFLGRWGVVTYDLIAAKETLALPWSVLRPALLRLVDRGVAVRGAFVAGMSPEQFAHPQAIASLSTPSETLPAATWLIVNAADPLNLTALLPNQRPVPSVPTHQLLLYNGLPAVASISGCLQALPALPAASAQRSLQSLWQEAQPAAQPAAVAAVG